MRITRASVPVAFYKLIHKDETLKPEPLRKPVHFNFTFTDDGKESSWLQQVQAEQRKALEAIRH